MLLEKFFNKHFHSYNFSVIRYKTEQKQAGMTVGCWTSSEDNQC